MVGGLYGLLMAFTTSAWDGLALLLVGLTFVLLLSGPLLLCSSGVRRFLESQRMGAGYRGRS